MSDVLRGTLGTINRPYQEKKEMLRVGINVSFKIVPHFPPSAKYWWGYINFTDFFEIFLCKCTTSEALKGGVWT